MIRTKGEAGTGNVVEAVRHQKTMVREIQALITMTEAELIKKAEEYRVPVELVRQVKNLQKLPVVNFAAGGIATPADAALLMQLGSDGVFVGSGIFKSANPEKRARAIVEAVMYYNNPEKLAKVSENLGEAMSGIDVRTLDDNAKLATRGN